MAQPVWITQSGSLGTVPEGIYYNVPVQAQAGVGETVFYKLIAGSLPTNVFCDLEGVIAGVPSAKVIAGQNVSVAGVLITSEFTIRAYTTLNNQSTGTVSRLRDQTFTITVAGANAPGWITPAGDIGSFYDGTLLQPGFQFEYTDNPLPGVVPITLVSGQLPPGITISGTGLMSGYFAPDATTDILAGFSRDGQGFDEYGFDFNTDSLNNNYEFTLQVTNGIVSQQRTFTMLVWATTSFVASTTRILADTDELPASISNIIPPVIINPQGSIGTYRNDNFFAYQFIAYDYSNNPVVFEGFDLPPGLSLDATTGWLYGYIPDLGVTEETYTFTVRVSEPFDVNPYSTSPLYTYSITYVGPIGSQIVWVSPSDLGTINNGSTSTFTIIATDVSGVALQYRIKSGSNSRLPQGLTLLPSGNIVGRVSFNTFSLDSNTTTIDAGTTTFDLTYTFIVNAYSVDSAVSVFKEFTIHVVNAYPQPYNNLYISCTPPRADRVLIQDLLQDDNIFPQALLYRSDDPNFGVSTSVVYNHAYGLTATTISDYVASLELNHYWKNLILGEIKTARAVDDLGNVIYEVVYSEVIDDLVNNAGESVSKEVLLPYPVTTYTSQEINNVYPNALVDMRDQVIDVVGQVSNILPRWMYSQQADGRILGFTPAWVIAYTQPNASGQIAYNIEQQYGVDKLNLVDFKADRYEIDRSMTALWDSETITVAITDIVGNGTIATIDYATTPAITILPGDIITVAHVIPTGYNGTYYVLTSDSNQITVRSSVSTAWVDGGTITSTPHWIPDPAEEVTFDIADHYQLTTQTINPPTGSGYTVPPAIPSPPPLTELTAPGEYFTDTSLEIFGNTVNGSTTITTVSATLSMRGAAVNGASIPAGTIVSSVVAGVSITISAPATSTESLESITLILLAPEYDFTARICQVSDTGGIEQAFIYGYAPYNSAGTVWPAVPALSDTGPAATSSSATILAQGSRTVAGQIDGTRLSATGGAPAVGQVLSRDGVLPYTYIESPIFGVLTSATTYTSISGTSAGIRNTWNNISVLSTTGAGTNAVFDIRKTNTTSSYTGSTVITLVYGGEGYKVGDRITIAGADLGGTTPANNLTFTLGTSVSNGSSIPSYWNVSVSQTTTLLTSNNARTYSLDVGGTITGTFGPGEYITSTTAGITFIPGTQIITQLTSTTTAVATTTATGSANSIEITVASKTGIVVGQIVSGTGIPSSTFVTAISTTTNIITLSQALTATASGSYIFRAPGGSGTYAVNIAQSESTPTRIIATDAIFNIKSVPGVQTIFDGGSMTFSSPADVTTNTNAFDRYLLFPKYNVLDDLPSIYAVSYTNNDDDIVEWTNASDRITIWVGEAP